MKLSKILIVASLAVAFGTEVRAATVTISQTNSFANLTTGTRTLSFNLLDSAFGSSVAVSDIVAISITGIMYKSAGAWTVENLENNGVYVDFYQITKGWFTSAMPSLPFAPGSEASPHLISDYDHRIFFQPFEKISSDFGSSDTGGPIGGELLSNDMFSDYLGSGTFDIVVNALQSTSVVGPGIDQSTSSPRLSGNVVVTYEIVPEPSTASLIVLGLGGLAGLRRARRI